LKSYIDRVIGSFGAGRLFPKKPVIPFGPDVSVCCGYPLKVQKTRAKTVATLAIGEFVAKETVYVCPQCRTSYSSDELRQMVPTGSKFGYDVLVFVGKAAFLRCRSDTDIIGELAARNIRICPSEIAYLQKRFIVYLATAHKQSAVQIREVIKAWGGYILHLDGTCEGDSPHLMSGLDELSHIVLHNVKMASEKTASIVPFLEHIRQDYGMPLALVSDMSQAIAKAIKEVFEDVPHFVCHFHFLRDTGNDLMTSENDLIRKRLRKFKIVSKLHERSRWLKQIMDENPELLDAFQVSVKDGRLPEHLFELAPVVSTYGLVRWALAGLKQGQGYGFPFDRAYVNFVKRLRILSNHLDPLCDIKLCGHWQDNKPFYRVCHDVTTVVSDKKLKQAMRQIESKSEVFDALRDAMRITVDCSNQGLNDDGQETDIKCIEEGVKRFRDWLIHDNRFEENNDYGKMIKQIDLYWEKLFADPIEVNTSQGQVTFQPQRTNNLLERFFRDIKRSHRRKSGTQSMNKKLRVMLADTPLVKNLENKNYIGILLNGNTTLEGRFSEIDVNIVREELNKSQEHSERIPAVIRRLIKKPDLPQIITDLFQKAALSTKSNRVLWS
jgi:hypothetical protein